MSHCQLHSFPESQEYHVEDHQDHCLWTILEPNAANKSCGASHCEYLEPKMSALRPSSRNLRPWTPQNYPAKWPCSGARSRWRSSESTCRRKAPSWFMTGNLTPSNICEIQHHTPSGSSTVLDFRYCWAILYNYSLLLLAVDGWFMGSMTRTKIDIQQTSDEQFSHFIYLAHIWGIP